MAKITLFFAVFLAAVATVLCQTEAEIKNQLYLAKAVSDAYEYFYKVVQNGGYDVDSYQEAISRLFPAIKSLRGLFAFASTFFGENHPKLQTLKEGFRYMNTRIYQINMGLNELRDYGTYDNSVLQLYENKRSPIIDVERNARLFAEASSSVEERRAYLQSLRDQCNIVDPNRFLIERSYNTQLNMSILSGNDRVRLVKWIKVITADAVRSMSMSQICYGVRYPPTYEANIEKEAQSSLYKVQSILDDLKQEGERISHIWDQYMLPDLNAIIYTHASANDLHMKIYNHLMARYDWAYFGIYVLNSEAAKNTFYSRRAIEIQAGEKTVLIFWLDKKEHDKAKQDSIMQYIATIPCPSVTSAVYFRTEALLEIQDRLRERGATAVYVTDGNVAAIAYPQVSTQHRVQCKGAEDWPVKKHWEYSRTIIVGY